MIFFLQLTITGISEGMMYALVAIGFVVILKCSDVFNIAQGHFVMIGAYLSFTFLVLFDLPLWAAIVMVLMSAVILGVIIERLALRPLIGQPVLAVIMMTIALSSVLEGLATLVWGGEYKAYHNVLPSFAINFNGISISAESLIGVIVSIIVVSILMLFFRYTKIGLVMRAAADDLQVVQSVGIKANTIYSVSWIIACIIGMTGGIIWGGVSGATVPLAHIAMSSFAVVLLGGANSIGGTIVAGIIVGVLKNVAAGYLDPLLPSGGGLAEVFPFIIMIIVLIFRPHGLFGLPRIERI